MRLLVVLLLVACSGSPRPAAPPLQARQATGITGGAVTFTDWSVSHVDSLVFTDGGERLVAAGYGSIVEIDPATRRQVGKVSLSSATVPHPRGRPGVGETLSWTVRVAVWAWDGDTVLGVAQLSAWGDAISGLAVWRPARSAPVAIPAAPGYLCEPLAIAPDRTAVIARVDTSKRGCGPAQTGAQVFSIETQRPLAPPFELGITRRAAFSPDGRFVAASGERGLVVMDLRAQKVVATLALPEHLTALAFHPQTNVIAWTDVERQLASWTIGEAKAVTHGPGQGIAFSPDGRFAATSRDGEVVLLDATTFRVRGAPLEGVRGTFVDAIAFSPDSTQLAVAISGTEIGVWQLEPRPATAFAGGWLQRLRPLPVPAPRPFPNIDHDGRLEGRVTVGDKPVANAEVTLEAHPQEYDDARALPKRTTRTKADGSYRFEDLPTIEYVQLVRAPGAMLGGHGFDMRKTKAHTGDVRLHPAATIRGKVVGPDGAPAGGARVFHARSYGTDEIDIAADATGRFVIDHLQPSTTKFTISARRADGAVRTTTLDISKPRPVDATIKLAAPTDRHVVHFLVVDAAGAPIAGAIVETDHQDAKTDASGKASIDLDPAHTHPRARARSVGGYSDYVDVALPASAPIKLVIGS